MSDTKVITHGYNHLDPGHPDNPYGYPICGARRRGDGAGLVCLNAAGKGTDHFGVGRCKYHGGNNPAGLAHPQYKGGRYAHVYRGRLAQRIAAMGESEDSPMDLLPELQAQRALVSLAIDALAQTLGDSVSSTGSRGFREGDRETTPTGNEERVHVEPPQHSQFSPPFAKALITSVLQDITAQADETVVDTVIDFETASDLLEALETGALQLVEPGGEYIKVDVKKLGYEMETLSIHLEKTMKMVESIQKMRNDTAVTAAELMFLQKEIERLVEEFIPDVDRRRQFFRKLKKATGL
jgi:hypothetical protein